MKDSPAEDEVEQNLLARSGNETGFLTYRIFQAESNACSCRNGAAAALSVRQRRLANLARATWKTLTPLPPPYGAEPSPVLS